MIRLIRLLMLCGLLGLPTARAGSAPGSDRPNILLIIGDDHAAWTTGALGDPRQATPNIDRLAREGVLFEHAYCNSPLCTPSRQSLITGKMPHAVGVTLLTTPLPADAVTLGDWAGRHGYDTAAIGKMHFNSPLHHGFTTRADLPAWEWSLRISPPSGGDGRKPWRPFKDPARQWLNSACEPVGLPQDSMASSFFVSVAAAELNRKHSRPFAMVVGFYEPHSPFWFPRGWEGRYKPSDFDVPPATPTDLRDQPAVFADLTPSEIRGIQAAYFTSLAFLDHQVGRLIAKLDASPHGRNTIVVYVGDNGYMLGRHARFEKHCFFEEAVRVPLIIRWPAGLKGGRRVRDQVEFIDVLPTVLALAGIPLPDGLHGMDLGPLLRGEPGARGREVVFSEYLENEEAMVRTERYKLIVGLGERVRNDGYKTRNPTLPGHYIRLYDEQTDPRETRDLSASLAMAPVREALQSLMLERMRATSTGVHSIPSVLKPMDAIYWRLRPRDLPPGPAPKPARSTPRPRADRSAHQPATPP